jgi:hypothetical protein
LVRSPRARAPAAGTRFDRCRPPVPAIEYSKHPANGPPSPGPRRRGPLHGRQDAKRPENIRAHRLIPPCSRASRLERTRGARYVQPRAGGYRAVQRNAKDRAGCAGPDRRAPGLGQSRSPSAWDSPGHRRPRVASTRSSTTGARRSPRLWWPRPEAAGRAGRHERRTGRAVLLGILPKTGAPEVHYR